MSAAVNALAAVLSMSGWGTAAAGAAVLLYLVLRRPPCARTALLLLWAVVGFRLLCPAAPASALSLFNLGWAGGLARAAEELESGYAAGAEVYLQGTGEYERAVAAGARPERDESGRTVVYWQAEENAPAPTVREAYGPALAAVWLTGAGAMLVYGGASYLLLRRRLRFAVKDGSEPGVWLSDRVEGPCAVGVFRPRICLPFGLTEEQRTHILAHEREHLRTGDSLWKALGWVILSVHWFNPLLWAAYGCFAWCLEDACDQRTLERLGGQARAAYSQTLLDLTAGRSFRPGPSPLAFGEGNAGRRVRAALGFRRPVRWATAAALAAVAVAGVLLATGRMEDGDRLRVVEVDGVSCVDVGPRTLSVRLLGDRAAEIEAEIRADYEDRPSLSSTLPGVIWTDFDTFQELQEYLGRVPLRENTALRGALYNDLTLDPWDEPRLVPAVYSLEMRGMRDGTIERGNIGFNCYLDGFRVRLTAAVQFHLEPGRAWDSPYAALEEGSWFYDMANGGQAYVSLREGQETGTVLMAWTRLDGVSYRILLDVTEETAGPGAPAAAREVAAEILDGFVA